MEREKQQSPNLKVDATKTSSEARCPKCGLELALGTTVCPNDGTVLAPEFAPGSQFAGKYMLTQLIGKGGMSAVYLATDALLGRTVAIKLLHQYLAQDSIALKRFRQEARTVSQLNHPEIVRIYEFGILDHGQPYIVMDYIKGMSLAQLIKRHGIARPEDAVALFRQITEALVHAHSHGVLHRDLKPSNVMLAAAESGDGLHVTLVDFGIAKVVAEDDAGRLTATGEVIGSPIYMSPEQARGMALDERSDLYSLGCLMYEAISGKPVVSGENALDILFTKLNKDPLPLAEAAAGLTTVPPALESIVSKLIEREPDARYQTAKELLADLENIDLAAPAVRKPGKPVGWKKVCAVAAGIGAIAVLATAMIRPQANVKPVPSAQQTATTQPVQSQNVPALTPTDESLRLSWQRMFNQQKLYLNHTMVTDAGLKYVGEMTPLVELNLNSTAVKDLTPLQRLHNLQQLDLGKTRINDQSLQALTRLPVWKLILTDDSITDEGVKSIAQMTNLAHIDLAGTSVTDEAIGPLSSLPNLHGWVLDRTSVGDEFARRLPAKQTEWVAFGGAHVTNDGLRSIASRLTNLKGITYGDTKSANDESVDIICTMQKLQQIYLNRDCATDTTLKKIAKLKNLETVGLDLGSITHVGISYLKPLKGLHSLQLNYDQLDDFSVEAISSLRGLETLSLVGNDVTDSGLPALTKLENLRSLNLSGTKITGAGLSALRPLKKLQSLTVKRIDATVAEMKQFEQDHPGCLVER